MAQWAHLGRARAPFHLYVPAGSVDIARRLASENQVNVSEIWSYHTIGDQTRFTLVHRAPTSESRRACGDRASPPKAAARAEPTGGRASRGLRRPPAPARPQRQSDRARPPATKRGTRRETAPTRTKKGSKPCPPAVQPRQARLREHLRRPHAAPRRSRTRILYWFRTPPGVRVGRAALDEDAIRLIEQHNPDVEFDWTQILNGEEEPAPPAPPARPQREAPGRSRARVGGRVPPPPPGPWSCGRACRGERRRACQRRRTPRLGSEAWRRLRGPIRRGRSRTSTRRVADEQRREQLRRTGRAAQSRHLGHG